MLGKWKWRYEFLTAVIADIMVFWSVTPTSSGVHKLPPNDKQLRIPGVRREKWRKSHFEDPQILVPPYTVPFWGLWGYKVEEISVGTRTKNVECRCSREVCLPSGCLRPMFLYPRCKIHRAINVTYITGVTCCGLQGTDALASCDQSRLTSD
jgi:hypothetical protein